MTEWVEVLKRSCSECAMCRGVCPAANTLDREPSAPRSWALVRRRGEEQQGRIGSPEECTGCYRCTDFCYGHYPLPLLLREAGAAQTIRTVRLAGGSTYLGVSVAFPLVEADRVVRIPEAAPQLGGVGIRLEGEGTALLDPLLQRRVRWAAPGVHQLPHPSSSFPPARGDAGYLHSCFRPPLRGPAGANLYDGDGCPLWIGPVCCGAASAADEARETMARRLLGRLAEAGVVRLAVNSEACASHLRAVAVRERLPVEVGLARG